MPFIAHGQCGGRSRRIDYKYIVKLSGQILVVIKTMFIWDLLPEHINICRHILGIIYILK